MLTVFTACCDTGHNRQVRVQAYFIGSRALLPNPRFGDDQGQSERDPLDLQHQERRYGGRRVQLHRDMSCASDDVQHHVAG